MPGNVKQVGGGGAGVQGAPCSLPTRVGIFFCGYFDTIHFGYKIIENDR